MRLRGWFILSSAYWRCLWRCVIGLLLIQPAVQSDPDEAQGLGGALQALAQEPFGQWILGVVAVGFVAYAIYQQLFTACLGEATTVEGGAIGNLAFTKFIYH